MGEKKQKEAAQKKWKKVLFVVAAIVFVFVMVVSSTGMNWITGLAPIRAGDKVQLDYTIYDPSGNPLITTSENVYTQQYQNGRIVLYTPQLVLTANQTSKQAIYPIKVYIGTNGTGWQEFALYNPEINAISSGVIGMKANEQKHIVFANNDTLNALFTPEDLAMVNVNASSLNVGDLLSMGVSDTTLDSASNTSAATYMRMGLVTRKSDNGVVVDFGYPSVDITIDSFASQ
jgi:hypothetical protein